MSVPSPTSTTAIKTARPRTNLQSVFEDQAVLSINTPKALQTFASLGVQTVRVFIYWDLFAPDPTSTTKPDVDLTNPDSYSAASWAQLDTIDRDAAADHIQLVFDVGAPAPRWAEGDHPEGDTGGWKPNAADYGDFMQTLGTRYSGSYTPSGDSSPLPRIDYWSVWNEPNYIYLIPNAITKKEIPYAPRLYRPLVDSAFSGLAKSGHTVKTDTILIGETAPRGQTGPGKPGLGGGIYPLAFIRDLYCVSSSLKPLTGSAATTLGCPASGSVASFRAQNPGLFDASGWADHPYSDTTPPTEVTPDEPDAADFATLDHLEGTLDGVFKAYGSDRQIPIYNTEDGYKTNPPTPLGVSYSQAAAWDNETEYLSWLNPRIRSYSQYLLIDPVYSVGNDFDTGLENPTSTQGVGTPKPDVYEAYRMPLWLPKTTATKGQKLEVWGCARPVNDMDVSSATVDIQFASGSSTAYTTQQTATVIPKQGGCYFTANVAFPASGTVRLSFDYDGSPIYSRTQAVTIH